ncbi:Clavaminate synthase-like protein [Marasmius fiardii PR-910]|nr:Clavaminate synthase-like protein [Marasmius fiardii PR-910]
MSETVQVPPWVPAKPTSEDLEYADLPIIDLSLPPREFLGQVEKIKEAMETHGFLYCVNHPYSVEEMSRIFSIANVPFTESLVPFEEKKRYEGTMKVSGSYQGYKLREYWHIDKGVRDQVEIYNLNRDITKREHPTALRSFLPEIQEFAKNNHYKVLHPILRLLALGLDLPENTFVDMHGFDSVGETYVRFMKYFPRTEEDEVKSSGVWLKGHTDIGSITILYSQPVAALQILGTDGKWRWVKHLENALVINAGDAMEFISGGIYRATIHRVVQPPPDQRTAERLGVYYFCLTDDDVKLAPVVQDPRDRRFESGKEPTMEVWRKERTSRYGQSELKQSTEAGREAVEEEMIGGVVVRHYN